MISIFDERGLGIRVGFFCQGRFIKDPDIDALIKEFEDFNTDMRERIERNNRNIALLNRMKQARKEREALA